jgi:hypothetical protein
MATQPADNPGDTPAEFPNPANEPEAPGGPDETQPTGPDVYEPDSAPTELPPPD